MENQALLFEMTSFMNVISVSYFHVGFDIKENILYFCIIGIY